MSKMELGVCDRLLYLMDCSQMWPQRAVSAAFFHVPSSIRSIYHHAGRSISSISRPIGESGKSEAALSRRGAERKFCRHYCQLRESRHADVAGATNIVHTSLTEPVGDYRAARRAAPPPSVLRR